MTISATSSVTASPVDRYLVRTQTSKGVVDQVGQVTNTVLEYGKQGVGVIGNVWLAFSGFLMILGGAIGKTLAPEKTAWDLLSLVAMIGGAITSIMGFGKLWKANNKAQEQPIPEAHEKVSDILDSTLKPLVKECNNLDPAFLKVNDFSSKITRDSKDPGLRTLAINLFNGLSGDELAGRINSHIGGAPKRIHFANQSYTTAELKDKIALLLGYIVSSRDTEDDPAYKDILENRLKDEDVEKGQCRLLSILPNEFSLVYEVARDYERYHNQAGQENPINYIFTRKVEDLETILSSTGGSAAKDDALNYLRSYTDTYNKFKVLEQAIKYVLNHEDQASRALTSGTSRNAALIRQALVTAFCLKGKDNSEVLQELKRIYEGDERNPGSKTGLATKIKELETYKDLLIQIITKGKVNVRFFDKSGREPNSNIGNIFPSGINLIEIREVTPEPV